MVMTEDITGTLGMWFDSDMSDVPPEAITHLEIAYTICAKALAGSSEEEL